MNERIRELAIKAGAGEWGDSVVPAMMDIEKFTELLVRECVQTLIDNTPVLDEYESQEDWDKGYDRAMRDCVDHIKEHFGVRE